MFSQSLDSSYKPFFHVFQTSEGNYLFDVNTDRILKIPEDVYKYLYCIESGMTSIPDSSVSQYIEDLKNDGYLSSNRVKEIEHPATELLTYYIKNKLNLLTLQVTQSCNLRCNYCVYSGEYRNRDHSDKTMSKETAQKAIDYYISHSRDTKRLSIGFYGGEPLLSIGMIKYCVEYANKNAEGRIVNYSLTTNGTLFTKDIVQYLVDNDFRLVISLDGPAHIHNKNRKYANKDKGTHETIIKNIRFIKQYYPLYYKDNIAFNTVLDPNEDFSCVNNYVMSSEEFEESSFSSSLIDDRYRKQDIPYNADFFTDREYETFKLFLNKLNWLKDYSVSKFVEGEFTQICRSRGGRDTTSIKKLPDKFHRGESCIPVMRLFVSADGYFYPCERISEASKVTRIGDVTNGVNIEKAEQLLNIERVTPKMCRDCWAYLYCQACVSAADDLNEMSPDLLKKNCPTVRRQIEGTFKDYCVIKELGYDFDSEENN